MTTHPPLPTPRPDWALFLDFDGTLVEIAPAPCAVAPAPRLRPMLAALAVRLGGAVALVSGRPLADLDWLLAPLVLPAAGLHGLERRRADGAILRAEAPEEALAAARARLADFAARTPGVLLEDKGLTLALHYRGAPERAADCRRAARDAAAVAGGALHLLEGKMVVELRPEGGDKGAAIAAFLAEPPFAGRTPVFAGDDRTDEDGFAVVAARGGISLRVGDGRDSVAQYRIASVEALLDWLAALAAEPPLSPAETANG